MDNFVNLHVHSHYSIGDSVIKISELVKKVNEYEQSFIALTDHGSTMGWFELQQECKNNGQVYPIFGNEIYCKEDYSKPDNQNRFHLVLLAQNEQGLQNIRKIQRISVAEHFYYKPLVPHDLIFENTEGIFCSTACALSYINYCFLNNDDYGAYDFFNKLLDNFGRDNVAVELQYHPTWKIDNQGRKYPQNYLNEKLIDLYENTDAKYIINTFDSHVLTDKGRILRKKIQSINWKKPEDDINDTLKSNVLGTSALCFDLAHESGIEDDKLIQKCIDNTHEIAEKCYFVPEHHDRVIPKFTQHKHFKEIFLKKVV